MASETRDNWNRRAFLAGTAALIGAPALAQSVDGEGTVEIERDVTETVRHNISSFRTLSWEPYFSNLKNGAILVDIDSRAVHFWNEDQSVYKLYPSSVPLTEDLTRRGRTSVVRKVEGPSWRPTPSMLERNPEWPAYVGRLGDIYRLLADILSVGVRRHRCWSVIPNGRPMSGRALITRWARTHFTLAGHIIESTAPTTHAKSGVVRPMDVSVFTTNTSPSCSEWPKWAPKCCLFDEKAV